MAKRSAKQKANDRKLGKMAKFRFRKTNKQRSVKKSIMATRSRSKRLKSYVSRKGFNRNTGGKIINTIRPMATGIGMGEIAETIAMRVSPQFAQMAGYGGAYIGGGLKGVGGKIIYDMVLGKGSPLGSIGLFGGRVGTDAL